MKKSILLILILILSSIILIAQDVEGLRKINSKSKALYVKPEALDQLMIELRSYENSASPVHDTLLLETYKSISSGYAVNNHYRQAYEVYRKYLNRKEKFLATDMYSAINLATGTVSERKLKDESETGELQNRLQTLIDRNELLESRRLSFKRNFSFALIVLSSIFAIMLVGSGIRMMSLRSKHRQNNERMKNIHRLAVVGHLSQGLRNTSRGILSTMETQIKEILQLLKKQEQSAPVKQSSQVVSGIEKLYSELISKFK